MTRVEKYRKSLRETAAVLRKKYTSAAELAGILEVSRQTAYTRIKVLRSLPEFYVVEAKIDRVSPTGGPEGWVYRITGGAGL